MKEVYIGDSQLDELQLATGEEITLNPPTIGGVPKDFESDSGQIYRGITLRPPLRYLGHGREKIVVSAGVTGAESLTTRAAIGLLRTDPRGMIKMTGLGAFRHLKDSSLPTYPWYLQSTDHTQSIYPDLSLTGTIVSSNTSSLSHETRDRLQDEIDNISHQIAAIIRRSLQLNSPLYIAHDTYFFIIKPKNGAHVLLGDFDGFAITQNSGPLFQDSLCHQADDVIDKLCNQFRLKTSATIRELLETKNSPR